MESDSDNNLNSKTKQFHKGESIYKSGTEADELYQIKHGHVFLYSMNEIGKKLIDEVKQEGDFLGAAELIAHSKHPQTAQCVDEVEVVIIDKKTFDQVMCADHTFCRSISHALAEENIYKQEKTVSLTYSSVYKRLLHAIIDLDDKFNQHKTYPFFIEIKRNDLAALSGTVKETTIRTLKSIAEDGTIELNRNGVTVIDRERLEKAVHSEAT